jgi:outer membrane biosynthesis protein TonB
MKITSFLSVLLHLGILLFAWLGLPSARPMPIPVASIQVEIVTEEALKMAKVAAKPPEPVKPKPAKKPPPPPPPQKTAALPPEPVKPPPAPEEAVAIPDLKPTPKPKETPKPIAKKRPRPKAKPKPKPRKVAAKPPPQKSKKKPKAKPKPPPKNDFASVLKTVENLKQKPRQKPPEKKAPVDQKTFLAQLEKKLRQRAPKQPPRIGAVLSNSELNMVRRQIEQCWNLPAGARGAENMVVEIRTVLNPDGQVRSAQIMDSGRLARDPFYRSMAESARRAILNPRCQPLRLPLDKYDEWQVMVLNFDPRGMF